jgi:hypothetical protein
MTIKLCPCRLGEIDGMAMNTQSFSDSARISLLARIAHSLTICARDTYEVETDNILEPQVLRSYNELLHRVTGAVVSHALGRFLNRALQHTEKGATAG